MKLLSLDISTTNTGYATFEDIILLQSGAIYVPTVEKELADTRFYPMGTSILSIIRRISPDVLVVESSFMKKVYNSIEYPLKLHGLIEFECHKQNIIYRRMTPASWRSKTGVTAPKELKGDAKRKALKKDSIRVASLFAGRIIETDDEADAINIGVGYLIKYGAEIKNPSIH